MLNVTLRDRNPKHFVRFSSVKQSYVCMREAKVKDCKHRLPKLAVEISCLSEISLVITRSDRDYARDKSLAVKTTDWEQVEFSSNCIDFRKLWLLILPVLQMAWNKWLLTRDACDIGINRQRSNINSSSDSACFRHSFRKRGCFN